jgi:hypothetical protein
MVILGIISGATAGAALVSVDDPVFGIGAITRDTATGLEWLDVSLSNDRSFLDVAGQFGMGGDFEGFRHATGMELIQLYSNAGIPDIDVFGGSTANLAPVMGLIDLVGHTRSQGEYLETFGLVDDIAFQSLRFSGDLDFLTINSSPAYAAMVLNGFARSETIAFDFVGHWLVRPVPVPSSFILLTTGLALLGGIIRRNKSAGQ